MNLKKAVLLVAGGSGTRMQQNVPKQYLPLGRSCVLMHTIDVFHQFDAEAQIILVLSESHLKIWDELCEKYQYKVPHKVAFGGKTRFHSVQNGLALLDDDVDIVAVHDGVRPFVSEKVIRLACEHAQKTGAAIPVVPAIDSLRRILANHSVGQQVLEEGYTDANESVSRSQYVQVQTPQIFSRDILFEAYMQPYDPNFTDDASVVEKKGHAICLTLGDRENIKLTTPWDMQIAETMIAKNEH